MVADILKSRFSQKTQKMCDTFWDIAKIREKISYFTRNTILKQYSEAYNNLTTTPFFY